ncbi:MAG: DUF1223 domain-containing protein [Candidatus Omnitrophica bacterium]|nr:DUF1223 domain-containing protein [Candidatus Omnitrophota bacterium]
MKRIFSFMLLLGLFLSDAQAALPSFQSGSEQVSLLELYSSEGCSSCPPADAWISQFQTHPDLWKKFVPVVFHVTYWNRLGWKDHFSSPGFDERQKAYVDSWKGWNVYTPAVVLNGAEWESGPESKTIPDPSQKQIGILSAKALDEQEYLVTFKPVIPISKPLEIHGALLGFAVSSQIMDGENIGKKLTHNFLVLNYRKKNLSPGEGNFVTSVVFSLARKSESARLAAAFWITEKGKTEPLQAAGSFV